MSNSVNAGIIRLTCYKFSYSSIKINNHNTNLGESWLLAKCQYFPTSCFTTVLRAANFENYFWKRDRRGFTSWNIVHILVLQPYIYKLEGQPRYKVSRGTLQNQLAGKHTSKPGSKAVFSTPEESSIVDHIQNRLVDLGLLLCCKLQHASEIHSVTIFKTTNQIILNIFHFHI